MGVGGFGVVIAFRCWQGDVGWHLFPWCVTPASHTGCFVRVGVGSDLANFHPPFAMSLVAICAGNFGSGFRSDPDIPYGDSRPRTGDSSTYSRRSEHREERPRMFHG